LMSLSINWTMGAIRRLLRAANYKAAIGAFVSLLAPPAPAL
jgi:hypothetical protein